MRTKNTKLSIGILYVLKNLTSCTSRYCNVSKVSYGNNHENIISYTLSLRDEKFYFTKTNQSSFGSSYEGSLIKLENNEYELKSLLSPDSMCYPVTYKKDNNIGSKFLLELPNYLPFNKLLVDGNIYLDTIITSDVNLPKYMRLELNAKPHQIQIYGKLFYDEIFGKYEVEYKSKKYIVPDTCNHMVIDKISLDQYPIGLTNLKFNKQTMILYVDTNKIQFSKCKGKLTKFESKIHRQHLKRLVNP